MKHNKYKPYIRRMNGREKTNSLRIAIRLSFYQELQKAYVMVQHGFPLNAIEVDMTKADLKKRILPIALKRKTFNQWANDFKNMARNSA